MQRPAPELEAEILRLRKQTEEIQEEARVQYAKVPTDRDINWDGDAAVRICRRNAIEVNKLRWALGETGKAGMRDVLDMGPITVSKEDVIKMLTQLRLVGDMARFGPVMGELQKRNLVYIKVGSASFDQIVWMPTDNPQSGWANQSTAELHTLFMHCVIAQQRIV